jgi:hypothetical protein
MMPFRHHMKFAAACWFAVLLLWPMAAAAVGLIEAGDTREDVIRELGASFTQMKFGAFETLQFKDGTRVTLQNGRVTEVRAGGRFVENFQTANRSVQAGPKDSKKARPQNGPEALNLAPKEASFVPPQPESTPPEPKRTSNSIPPTPHPATAGIKVPSHSDQALAEATRPGARPVSTNRNHFGTAQLHTQIPMTISFAGGARRSLNPVAGLIPSLFRLAQGLALLFLGLLAGVYLFTCHCFRRICQKAGVEPGFLIWIPLAQIVPLLRAAQMAPWTLILLFVPLVNLVIVFSLWTKICIALGKNPWLVLLLLVPIANLGLIAYLAFSDLTPQPTELKDPCETQSDQAQTVSV